MKRVISILALTILMLTLFVSANESEAISFTAWVGMTGSGKFAINPFVYYYIPTAYQSFSVSLDLVVAYGFTDNIDVIANLSTVSIFPNLGWVGFWVMPRYDLGSVSILSYNILALQVGFPTYPTLLTSLQYHTALNFIPDLFITEVNLIISYIGTSFSLSAVIAPALKLSKEISLYLEYDPTLILPTLSYSQSLIPGIDINLSSFYVGEISIGFDVISTRLVAWYFIAF